MKPLKVATSEVREINNFIKDGNMMMAVKFIIKATKGTSEQNRLIHDLSYSYGENGGYFSKKEAKLFYDLVEELKEASENVGISGIDWKNIEVDIF